MFTWKLNETNSKPTPGEEKLTTVVYEAAGDQVHVTIDGADANGKPIHNEWTGKVGGKDYGVIGDPKQDIRSYQKLDAQALKFADKKGEKATATGHLVVSANGKLRTRAAKA